MPSILDQIVQHKRQEVALARQRRPLAELQAQADSLPPPRDFLGALRARHPLGLIAEIKRASPSAGLIRPDFDPVAIARIYEASGAACISVLTDEKFFQGSLDDLRAVRAAVSLPLLRKDFIIDPYQVWEARAASADCILLIAECLNDQELGELYHLAHRLGLQVLIEVYDPENVSRVLQLGPPLIGVNNRDLRTFVTDLKHTVHLRAQVPPEILMVGESGIHTRDDALYLQNAGVHAILVGESLMRSADIAAAVHQLLGTGDQPHPAAS